MSITISMAHSITVSIWNKDVLEFEHFQIFYAGDWLCYATCFVFKPSFHFNGRSSDTFVL